MIAEDTRIISGEIVPGGVECPLFQVDSGERFALQGLPGPHGAIGEKLTIRGFPARMSTCQQGDTFQVLEVLE